MNRPQVFRVSGPLVVAKNCLGAKMYDTVRIGKIGVIGEIIELKGEFAYIQAYEDTTGIGPKEEVILNNKPLSIELGPGLLGKIFDGIGRPLEKVYGSHGDFIVRGVDLPTLDRDSVWEFEPLRKEGEYVKSGDIIGRVKENALIEHRIMVPFNLEGYLRDLKGGQYRIDDSIGYIEKDKERIPIRLYQSWPVRRARPYSERLMPKEILSTGQRVIDTFSPLAKGGTACVPGPFGAGKTVIQHQLAKWSDAQIIVYVACGERGNETADLLLSFPELKDPNTGRPLIERTVIIANTSNMPVSAREASIYTGVTIGEYFRDMGYSVALMADSTSRWAEALREISGRMEEMPGEEGYPAYLPARLAEFYERAGRVKCLGDYEREGSLTIIGAVSPPGGDLSDPVVQATLKVVKVFWGLDDKLANARHFPAINWLNSYSLYHNMLEEFKRNIGEDYNELYLKAMRILEEEEQLREIVRLVGLDALSKEDRLKLEVARSIREDFLHQNAFHPEDTYTPLTIQYSMLKAIIEFYNSSYKSLQDGNDLDKILNLTIRKEISTMKYIFQDKEKNILKIIDRIKEEIGNV